MSGQWPPEWEDSDTGLPDEWDLDDPGLDPESSMVTSLLASMPSPVLPSAFEARISAAIAAEATARADGTESAAAGPVDAETTDRSSSPLGLPPAATESGSGAAARYRRRRTSAPSRGAGRVSGPTGTRPDGRRRRPRMPSVAVSASLLVLLVIAGLALAISQLGGGSSTSSGAAVSGASESTPSVAAGSAHDANGRYFGSLPQSGSLRGPNFQSLKFSISESGISYRASTLASQVRTELNGLNPVTPAASAPSPASSDRQVSSSAPASIAPPAKASVPSSLKGCVSYLTKGTTPSLVDRATYDGKPAYIIAVPSRVWVVRLSCSAADPQEITSVSLTGLSGNLSALGSVKGYACPEERRIE